MALVKCPDCGKMVSSRAPACPECGYPSEYFEDAEIDNNKSKEEKESLVFSYEGKNNVSNVHIDNSNVNEMATLHRGNNFVIIKPVIEVVKRALELEREMKTNKSKGKELEKESFGEKPPQEPILLMYHIKGDNPERLGPQYCFTKEQYDSKNKKYIEDLRKYEERKKKWEIDRKEKKNKLSNKYGDLLAEYFNQCSCINLPYKYRDEKALSFIYEYMSSSKCSLQSAFEAYDRQLIKDIQEQEFEEEQKHRKEEAQRRETEVKVSNKPQITEPVNNYEPPRYKVSRGYDDYVEDYDVQYRDDYYEDEPSRGSVLGGFIRDVAATAIGSSIANRGIKKELRRQREEEERREKERRNEEDRRKREAAHRSQVEWENVRRTNAERRRKGQPELPYPPRFYW